MKKVIDNRRISTEEFEMALDMSKKEKYFLRLYVTGSTPQSTRALVNIKNICEEYLKGRYELEVFDLYQNPRLSIGEQIVAIPTLIKKLPLPLRRVVGDMSNIDHVLVGLDLRKVNKNEFPL